MAWWIKNLVTSKHILNSNKLEGYLIDLSFLRFDSHKLNFVIHIHTKKVNGCFWQTGF